MAGAVVYLCGLAVHSVVGARRESLRYTDGRPAEIVDDLRAESDELDALVAPLADERWTAPTPAAGWTIAHQIGHLLWTDRVALLAVTDEDAFADVREDRGGRPDRFRQHRGR